MFLFHLFELNNFLLMLLNPLIDIVIQNAHFHLCDSM